jgi:hypothetical protein
MPNTVLLVLLHKELLPLRRFLVVLFITTIYLFYFKFSVPGTVPTGVSNWTSATSSTLKLLFLWFYDFMILFYAVKFILTVSFLERDHYEVVLLIHDLIIYI